MDRLVESILFVADAPVSLGRLVEVLGASRSDIVVALESLSANLRGRGIRLQRVADEVQLATAPESAPIVERFLGLEGSSRLSTASLETLAVVAYRQPVTRAQIENVRGVNSDRAVTTLLARELIEEVGRLDSPGRPAQFGTTIGFLEHLGLTGLDNLPELPELE